MNLSGKATLSFRTSATLSATYAGTGRLITADADYTLARSWAESADPGEHDALARFEANIAMAQRVAGKNLLCFRGQKRFPADYAPVAMEMGPPPVAKALANRYNKAKESVLYLCQSEDGVSAEPISGDGQLWIQRFSLPLDCLVIADFSSLREDDFLSKVFWFAELAGNEGVPVSLRFSQGVASVVSQEFDGMLVPGVRGHDGCRYSNAILFRPELRWEDWLESNATPYTPAQSHNNRLQRTVMDKVPRHEGQRAAAEPER